MSKSTTKNDNKQTTTTKGKDQKKSTVTIKCNLVNDKKGLYKQIYGSWDTKGKKIKVSTAQEQKFNNDLKRITEESASSDNNVTISYVEIQDVSKYLQDYGVDVTKFAVQTTETQKDNPTSASDSFIFVTDTSGNKRYYELNKKNSLTYVYSLIPSAADYKKTKGVDLTKLAVSENRVPTSPDATSSKYIVVNKQYYVLSKKSSTADPQKIADNMLEVWRDFMAQYVPSLNETSTSNEETNTPTSDEILAEYSSLQSALFNILTNWSAALTTDNSYRGKFGNKQTADSLKSSIWGDDSRFAEFYKVNKYSISSTEVDTLYNNFKQKRSDALYSVQNFMQNYDAAKEYKNFAQTLYNKMTSLAKEYLGTTTKGSTNYTDLSTGTSSLNLSIKCSVADVDNKQASYIVNRDLSLYDIVYYCDILSKLKNNYILSKSGKSLENLYSEETETSTTETKVDVTKTASYWLAIFNELEPQVHKIFLNLCTNVGNTFENKFGNFGTTLSSDMIKAKYPNHPDAFYKTFGGFSNVNKFQTDPNDVYATYNVLRVSFSNAENGLIKNYHNINVFKFINTLTDVNNDYLTEDAYDYLSQATEISTDANTGGLTLNKDYTLEYNSNKITIKSNKDISIANSADGACELYYLIDYLEYAAEQYNALAVDNTETTTTDNTTSDSGTTKGNGLKSPITVKELEKSFSMKTEEKLQYFEKLLFGAEGPFHHKGSFTNTQINFAGTIWDTSVIDKYISEYESEVEGNNTGEDLSLVNIDNNGETSDIAAIVSKYDNPNISLESIAAKVKDASDLSAAKKATDKFGGCYISTVDVASIPHNIEDLEQSGTKNPKKVPHLIMNFDSNRINNVVKKELKRKYKAALGAKNLRLDLTSVNHGIQRGMLINVVFEVKEMTLKNIVSTSGANVIKGGKQMYDPKQFKDIDSNISNPQENAEGEKEVFDVARCGLYYVEGVEFEYDAMDVTRKNEDVRIIQRLFLIKKGTTTSYYVAGRSTVKGEENITPQLTVEDDDEKKGNDIEIKNKNIKTKDTKRTRTKTTKTTKSKK